MGKAEEYLRRMRALGYKPSLAGMSDEDIEWELNRMNQGQREAQAEQPLYTRYKPVDKGLEARLLRQMGRPYDPKYIPKGEEFYIGGWDNGEDEDDAAPVARPDRGMGFALSRGGVRRPEAGSNPMETASKLSFGGGSLAGNSAGTGVRPMSAGGAGAGTNGSLLSEPKLQSKFQGPNAANAQLQGTFRVNQNSYQNMTPSAKVIDYIGEVEGFRPVPYRAHDTDPLTIGYGHVIKPGEDFSGGISKEEARALKLKDIKERVDDVNNWAKQHNIKLNQQQFDALTSFHYNTNSINTMEKLRDLIKSGNATPDELRSAFGEYYYSDGKRLFGLWKRRMDEADMYLNGAYERKEREMPKAIEFDPI
jgi:GH24 family phage-related lysozyme (muramidase)